MVTFIIAAATQPAAADSAKAFKPYGSPPPVDLEAERDSFPVWLERWNIFIALSIIDEELDDAGQPTRDKSTEILSIHRHTSSSTVSRLNSSTTSGSRGHNRFNSQQHPADTSLWYSKQQQQRGRRPRQQPPQPPQHHHQLQTHQSVVCVTSHHHYEKRPCVSDCGAKGNSTNLRHQTTLAHGLDSNIFATVAIHTSHRYSHPTPPSQVSQHD